MKKVLLALTLCAFASPAFANDHGAHNDASAGHEQMEETKTEVKATKAAKKKMKAKMKAKKAAVEETHGEEGAAHN